MIVDTSALLAFFDAKESQHEAVAAVITQTREPLVISPYVVAELDYLVLRRHGSTAEAAVLDELLRGAWELATMTADRLAAAARIVEKYRDVPVGIADASNIVLADAYRTRTIATLDQRHFSILRFSDGSAPQILP